MNNAIRHQADICVIGGGMSGMIAAISAARHGARVVLMHDRPVLGGNASSEIRMWIRGAAGKENRETGILQELELENIYRNPTMNYSLWDSVLLQAVMAEKNITLLLNCSCLDCQTVGSRITSVTGWQLNTYAFHTVEAQIFLDCSGDSILAPLCGAAYRVGREGQNDLGESEAPAQADRKTMGNSCLIEARQTDHPCPFIPPKWANVYPDDASMMDKNHDFIGTGVNFWWIELGGEQDTIADTQTLNMELLKIAFGVWDHIKNHGDHGADNWELEWVGFLPGKRESRRYVGDYVLTQHDVENCTPFVDTIAYGGWQIDNHLPGGFRMDAKGGAHLQKRRLSEPYPIPFRSLYSHNIENLMFAGRNISASHVAFSSTRVMGTIGLLGQAAGTGAAIAVHHDLTPRQACQQYITEIQDTLMEDDCFLPGLRRKIAPLSKEATLTCDYGDCSDLINGLDRRIWGKDNGYFGKTNKAVTYTFSEPKHVDGFRLVVDSDLNREFVEGNPDGLNTTSVMFYPYSHNQTTFGFPKCMIKHYKIEAQGEDGQWRVVYEDKENHQRFIKQPLDITARAVRFIPLSTYFSETKVEDYGSSVAHIFNFEVF